MIITISGLAGSGKSELARRLAARLNWPCYNVGALRRQAAAERGLTLAQYNALGESDPQTDLTVDRYQEQLGKTQDNFIIEGRTSWHFIPQSVKVFLTVEPLVGAERIWGHLQQDNERNEDHNLSGIADVLTSNEARLTSDRKRYRQYFNFDVYDPAHYDLVLDTTNLTPEEVLEKIINFISLNK